MAEAKTYEGNGRKVTITDPENITSTECLELLSCGKATWNSWRAEFPVGSIDPQDSLGMASSVAENRTSFSGLEIDSTLVDFRGFNFGAHADFSGCKFTDVARFEELKFESVDFSGAFFEYGAIFDDCVFSGNTKFEAAYLSYVSFSDVTFDSQVSFSGTIFAGEVVWFNKSKFLGRADFSGASWDLILSRRTLQKTEIYSRLLEIQLIRNNPRDIVSAAFSNVKFQGSVSFENRNFLSKLKFFECVFSSSPPIFQSASIPQGAMLTNTIFPKPNGTENFAASYRTLKLAFAQQQATREEQHFFRLEMQEEAAREQGWRRWLYRAYRELSDFGFSVGRPMILFLATTVLAALIYGWQAGLEFDLTNTHTSALIQFSLASAIPGLEKLAEPAALRLFGEVSKGIANYSLPTVLTLLAHKAVSLLALFLIGLALRNLFKMK